MEIEQLRYLLALLSLPGMGPATAAKIQRATKDLKTLFNEKGQYIGQHLAPSLAPMEGEINWSSVDADLKWLDDSSSETNRAILTLDHPLYPAQLKEIHAPPPVLFAMGDLSFLNRPQIAIVGSRNPTKQGRDLAFEFAEYFAGIGITVTSGLALGIDAAAHEGALQGAFKMAKRDEVAKETKVAKTKVDKETREPLKGLAGGTVAVLGNGLAQIYPKSHGALAEKITRQGVLLSEFSLHKSPESFNFPRRNRIIAGLSLGTLVVEAALKSGSLITAQYALNQGREVFAIPGSIHSPLAKGCHQLIQQGAKLVQTAQDVLEELEAYPALKEIIQKQKKVKELNRRHESIGSIGFGNDLEISAKEGLAEFLDKVSYGPTTVDALIEVSGLTVALVSSMLLELELIGAVVQVPGGYARTR